MWAPDVHYAGGQWRMYYVVTETKGNPTARRGGQRQRDRHGDGAFADRPVDGQRRPRRRPAPGRARTTTCGRSTPSGPGHRRHPAPLLRLVLRRDLPADARHLGHEGRGDETRIAIDNKFEGTYITRKNGYWYFFGSTANCCAGPTTGYSVEVARSRSLTGPYVDKDGLRIDVGGKPGDAGALPERQPVDRYRPQLMATDDAVSAGSSTTRSTGTTPSSTSRWDQPAPDAHRPDRLGARLARRPVRLRPERVGAARTGRPRRRSAPRRRAEPRRRLPRATRSTAGRLDRKDSDEFTGGTLAPGLAARAYAGGHARRRHPRLADERDDLAGRPTPRASCCATRPRATGRSRPS